MPNFGQIGGENEDANEGLVTAMVFEADYANPSCFKQDGKYYLEVNHTHFDTSFTEVSEEFYNAWVKEFKHD